MKLQIEKITNFKNKEKRFKPKMGKIPTKVIYKILLS